MLTHDSNPLTTASGQAQPAHLANHACTEGGHDSCHFQPLIESLRNALNHVLRGKQDAIELVLACLLARGHLLIEDLPGLGKTTLAKAIARSIGGEFARVQCTPDLLPSDITGFNLFNPKSREFEFHAGPVFSDVLLADEINRATPRTQSALFEAMAERQVTLDRICHRLPETFFVIATQNPVDSHGAYPLPEAQLDRFALRLTLGYPQPADEAAMLGDAIRGSIYDPSQIEPVVSLSQLAAIQRHVSQVEVAPTVRSYLVSVANASRTRADIAVGISPRGLLLWQSMCQAWAHLDGRDFVTPEDAHETALPVLSVRLSASVRDAQAVVAELLSGVPVPTSVA